jgi:hypothetical protein
MVDILASGAGGGNRGGEAVHRPGLPRSGRRIDRIGHRPRPVPPPQAGRGRPQGVSGRRGSRDRAIALAFADPPTRWRCRPARFSPDSALRARAGRAPSTPGARGGGWRRRAVDAAPEPGRTTRACRVVEQFTPGTACERSGSSGMGSLPRRPHSTFRSHGRPRRQGPGAGLGALAHAQTLRCEGLPAYLEATSERSVPFYRRHGFGVVTVIRIGGCPPITPMWRPARPR